MNTIQLWFIQQLISALLIKLDPETIKIGADAMLDAIENAVEKSENKFDDAVVLPLAQQLRLAFDVPDED